MFILGRNSDLDLDVARIVFKINEPENLRWGVPFFSVDRNAAAMVNTEMAFHEDGSRERYETELLRMAQDRGWNSGIPVLFMVLLPEVICEAAIIACQSSENVEALSDIDKDHP